MKEGREQLSAMQGEADSGPCVLYREQVLSSALLPITGSYKTQDACTHMYYVSLQKYSLVAFV